MGIENLVKTYIEQGLSDQEIALKVLGENKGASSEDIASNIIAERKASEVARILQKNNEQQLKEEREKKEQSAIIEKVDKLIDDKLKGIPAILENKFKVDKRVKKFDTSTGKFIENDEELEARGTFGMLLKSIALKEMDNVKAMSRDIDIENDRKMALLSGSKASPSVTDVNNRGGYAVPIEVSSEIQQLIYAESETYRATQKYVVNYNQLNIPTFTGFTPYWLSNQDATITDSAVTFASTNIIPYRLAVATSLSKLMIAQLPDIVSQFQMQMASVFAKQIDLAITSFSTSETTPDLFNGIVFNAKTVRNSAIALSSITAQTLLDLYNQLAPEAQDKANLRYISNGTVNSKIGMLQTPTSGFREFPGYIEGGKVSPFGINMIQNQMIPSTFNVATSKRLGGTQNVLILANMSKVVTALSENIRVESTDCGGDAFLADKVIIKAVKLFGTEVLFGSSTGGIVSVAQPLS